MKQKEENLKITVFNIQNSKKSKNKKDKKEEKNIKNNGINLKSYNSFDKNKIKKSNENFNENINFNLIYYYCFKKNSKKENEIKLFKSGFYFYKRRMDVVNVFTLLIFIENFLIENDELIP